MTSNRKMVFLTNFSEACFQAIPTVAEWMDREKGHLTIVHAASEGVKELEPARERLQSFFAEADRYLQCERVLLQGARVETILEYCRKERPSVVFAPASKPSGLPRVMHSSLRAKLIRSGGLRLWTKGRSESGDATPKAPRHVAYAITGNHGWVSEAVEAAKFAAQYDAKLHYLYLAPWPIAQEGMTADDVRLEMKHVSVREVRELAQQLPITPIVHTRMGDRSGDLGQLLKACRADVAFVGDKHLIRRRLWLESIHPELDAMDCEFVCYPARAGVAGMSTVASPQKFLEPARSR